MWARTARNPRSKRRPARSRKRGPAAPRSDCRPVRGQARSSNEGRRTSAATHRPVPSFPCGLWPWAAPREGLEAFAQFFSHLPADTGLAFVLVPHLEPTHKGMMPELLGRQTKMKVVEVEDGMQVQPNCVYVIPPNAGLGHPARQTPGARTGRAAGPADADRLLLPAVGGRPEGKGHRHHSFRAWGATARWACKAIKENSAW